MTAPTKSSLAAPTYFVGIVPPAALTERVLAWQARLEHVVTAPHVTLKAPGQFSGAQLTACEQACARTPAFEVQLGAVQTFPDRVVYLSASGAGLHALHAELVAAAGRSAGRFELEGYHPHLTLALGWRPLNAAWASALASAQDEFADLGRAPLRFTVTDAALFRKHRAGEPYRIVSRWPLSGRGG